MPVQSEKLGRNPLEKLADGSGSFTPGRQILGMGPVDFKGQPPTVIEKLKEMQLEVDWKELYATTVGRKLKELSRLLQRR